MKKVWLLFWIIVSSITVAVVLFSNVQNRATKASYQAVEVPLKPEIEYKSYTLPQSVVHTLLIPKTSRFSVKPVVSPTLEPVENIAAKHQTFAAINGGFFDPMNQKTTSVVIREGALKFLSETLAARGLGFKTPNLNAYQLTSLAVW